MTLQNQLARLEQRLLEQEHHFIHGLGHLDRAYVQRQGRRRKLTQAWMDEKLARIRELERELAALRKLYPGWTSNEVSGVVLTEEGFENG